MAERPLLLGHRGARKYAPENTLPAFQLALDHGCDGFEFDVRLTSDRQPVICHDPKFCGVSIASNTYEKLRGAGSRKTKSINKLEEALAFGKCAFLNMELKTERVEEILIELLRQYSAEKGLIVSSFQPSVITKLHELRVEFPLGIICETRRQLAKSKELPVQAVMVERSLVDQKLVDEIRNTPLKPKEGLNGAPDPPQIFVWTVNRAREMKRFADLGVDGIISDDTKLLVKTVRSSTAS